MEITREKYQKMSYDKKLKHQTVKNIVSNSQKDAFYGKVETPSGEYSVIVNLSCDCYAGSNYGIKKTLCTHQRKMLEKILELK
jgi:hypothetical protein